MMLLKLAVLIIAVFVFLYAFVGALVYYYRFLRDSALRPPPKLFDMSTMVPPPERYTETDRKNRAGCYRMLAIMFVSVSIWLVVGAL